MCEIGLQVGSKCSNNETGSILAQATPHMSKVGFVSSKEIFKAGCWFRTSCPSIMLAQKFGITLSFKFE